MGDFASAIGARAEEAAIVSDLKAGSEEAYAWLIGEFHQPIYSLLYRMVSDPADARNYPPGTRLLLPDGNIGVVPQRRGAPSAPARPPEPVIRDLGPPGLQM